MPSGPMTLEQIRHYERDWITAVQASGVLNADPMWIRYQARKAPEKLGFPTIVYRSRVKIPRRPFVKFFDGENIATNYEGGQKYVYGIHV